MGQKKEIGKFFETKLRAGKKIPTQTLWEKINSSLDEEKRKRKRILLYWWLGGGISFLLGLYLLFGAGNFFDQKLQIPRKNNTSEQNSFIYPKNKEPKKANIISEEDSLKLEIKSEEKLSKIEVTNEDKTLNKNENSPEKISKKQIQKGSSKGKSIDEIYTVSEKYYYYNSKDGKQMVTTNKNEIDSLVSQQYKSLDSIAIRKKDSIRQ